MGVDGSHKESKADGATTYPLEAGGREVGEREGGKDQGFLGLWAATRNHREGRAQTGVRVRLGLRRQSAVTVDARAQALMPERERLSSNPRAQRLSQISAPGLEIQPTYPTWGLPVCPISSFLDDRRAIWRLKALWQILDSGELCTSAGYKVCTPTQF